ncbi:tail fiber assembly protein [Hafnia paralvei]|uniref:tail fiber assembly protein n=1 Tax=Hafnia paralvei TaxID=546367 RepID=UPI001F203B92|nr:tail fiber assembly protein [Hafnia paralvei]MCE9947535.1 tail fiber assembly protein [Hafnia paralvei]
MINLMNFREKTKLTEDEQQQASDFGVIFLCDDAGNDWYESQNQFAAETIKVMYSQNGVICAVSDDVSKLWPLNMSVAEVDSLPDGFLSDGKSWQFVEGVVVERVYTNDELVERAQLKKAHLLEEATIAISPLQDASDLGIATDAELARLKAWKTYRVLLSRVDVSKAPDIDWPVAPSI